MNNEIDTMSESIPCPKCSQTFSTKFNFQRHLNKKIPCDLRCTRCDLKSQTKKEYHCHVLICADSTKEEKRKKPKSLLVNENKHVIHGSIVPINDIKDSFKIKLHRSTNYATSDMIPVQDFDKDYIEDLMNEAERRNSGLVVEVRYTFTPLQQQRAEKAINALNISDYANSLSCLSNNVNKVAASFLDNFHGDQSRPELQSIRLRDMSRMNVNILSRTPSPKEEIQWMPFAKEKALEVLSKHISKILNLALIRATEMLDYKYCVDKKRVCYCLHDSVKKRYVIITDDDGSDGLSAIPQLFVEIYVGELIDCPPEYKSDLYHLQDLIIAKGTEVCEQIKRLEFTEEDIMSFLERSRRPF